MISSALVVFREVFEIVLIVGIILAATKGMPHRNKAIYAGFGMGLFGAGLVAYFMREISAFSQGIGQELFNAAVLFTAALFIGWTLIWMKRHAREMKANFEKLGSAVSEGHLPFFSLSLVIALAILREGAEIILFTHGMLASGQSPTLIAAGSSIGLVSGAVLGVLLYMGLIKISTRHFFQITSWLLVFLVAGLMSQAVGFLSAAGAFEQLSFTVWDSSWLLSDGGIVGQSLGTLIGYTARPTAIQLIAYALSLAILIALIKSIDRKQSLVISAPRVV